MCLFFGYIYKNKSNANNLSFLFPLRLGFYFLLCVLSTKIECPCLLHGFGRPLNRRGLGFLC